MMKYNENSKFERPEFECPQRCENCMFFSAGSHMDTCSANGCMVPTFSFSNPKDRPLPMPLNCYWWYMNFVWMKVSNKKINEYREERLHEITSWRYLNSREFSFKERKEFSEHMHRQGGYGLIDFNVYPETKEIYEQVCAEDGCKCCG